MEAPSSSSSKRKRKRASSSSSKRKRKQRTGKGIPEAAVDPAPAAAVDPLKAALAEGEARSKQAIAAVEDVKAAAAAKDISAALAASFNVNSHVSAALGAVVAALEVMRDETSELCSRTAAALAVIRTGHQNIAPDK